MVEKPFFELSGVSYKAFIYVECESSSTNNRYIEENNKRA